MRQNLVLPLLFGLLCVSIPDAKSIETGFYSDFVPNAKPRKLISEIGMPDQRLDFHKQDEIRIPPVDTKTKTIEGIEVEVIDERRYKKSFLNQKRIRKVLKDKYPKNLLVVWFDKCMMMETGQSSESLQPFLRSLNFRRVVVLSASSAGVFVLQDKTFSETTSQNTPVS